MCCLSAGAQAGVFEPPVTDYERVEQGQTDQALGTTGVSGDVLENLLIIAERTGYGGPCPTSYPIASTSYPIGTVYIKDGSGSSIKIKEADYYNVNSGTRVQSVKVGARSTSGGWKVSTGCNVSVIGVGRFR